FKSTVAGFAQPPVTPASSIGLITGVKAVAHNACWKSVKTKGFICKSTAAVFIPYATRIVCDGLKAAIVSKLGRNSTRGIANARTYNPITTKPHKAKQQKQKARCAIHCTSGFSFTGYMY